MGNRRTALLAAILLSGCSGSLTGPNAGTAGTAGAGAGHNCGGVTASLSSGPPGSCTFVIGREPNSNTSNDFIDVYAGDAKIPYDVTHTSGWDYSDATHTVIQLFGTECVALVQGTLAAVSVIYRCAGLG